MKLIKTQDCLLLIDEKVSIDINNYIVAKDLSGIAKVKEYKRGHILAIDVFQNTELGISYHQTPDWNKIVAYYPLKKESKELDLPLLLNPFIGVDVEKLAKEYLQECRALNNIHLSHIIHAERCKNDFISGYKAAQSKQFSLEDMKKAFSYYAFTPISDQPYNDTELEQEFNQFIQSLHTQQLPKEFIPEYDIVHTDHAPNGFERLLKFKTNSEGKKVIQGTYKY